MFENKNAVVSNIEIKCDNESCDFSEGITDLFKAEDYHNKPCPKCGEPTR
jgi:hypothetical protein